MLDTIKKLIAKDMINPIAWEQLRRDKEKEIIAHVNNLIKKLKK